MGLLKENKFKNPQDRAIWNTPENAFDWSWPKVPRHQFLSEKQKAYDFNGDSLLIPLDISNVLKTSYMATTPSILARYIKINSKKNLSHILSTSGEIYYVLEGKGFSKNENEIIEWSKGDVFCFPGGKETEHSSIADNSILFLVTNEPLLNFEQLSPSNNNSNILPSHWPHEKTASFLEERYKRPKTKETSGVAVLFSTEETLPSRNTIPSINTSINTLEAGGDQRPHRHNGVAITLAIEGEKVYSMIEDQKIDWKNGVAQITPAAELHSHHNRGSKRMISFVVQDEGLHWYLRTTGFSWD
tara:strand:+ start:730 stop:1632 length:903 start_codon:yes stop_codon:yes gene_type:complete